MTHYDYQYKQVIDRIRRYGEWDHDKNIRPKWADGTPAHTKTVLNDRLQFDNGKELPILTIRSVPQIDPLTELWWIWIHKSNNVDFLNELGCTVWDEWRQDDGTIGRAYGWQLRNKYRKVKMSDELSEMLESGFLSDNFYYDKETDTVKLDQVDYLLYQLVMQKRGNYISRRIKTSLWGVEDLDDMALEPCVYDTHWQVFQDRLHVTVNIRSNDMGLGNPYNVYQYAILHRLIAQVTGWEVGTIVFNIDNAHVYDRHMQDLFKVTTTKQAMPAPDVWINPEVKSFYDFKVEDVKLIDYQHRGRIRLEVAE
jgi:thymidylate synthase